MFTTKFNNVDPSGTIRNLEVTVRRVAKGLEDIRVAQYLWPIDPDPSQLIAALQRAIAEISTRDDSLSAESLLLEILETLTRVSEKK